MDQNCDRLYPSAPLEEDYDLEERLEKKLNDVKSFNNSFNNLKEMVSYFKHKNHKSKERYKINKPLKTILESVDTIGITGARSNSITLSVTGIGLIIKRISAGIACNLSIGNKLLHRFIINKCNKYKKQYEKDEKTIKSFDELYRKSLQDYVNDTSEYKSL